MANGDRMEDQELEDEEDPDDDITDDNGFVNSFKNNRVYAQIKGDTNGHDDYDFGAMGTIKAMKHAEAHKPNRYSD